MWFKACTGDGEALATVVLLTFAAWWTSMLAVAAIAGWPAGVTAAAVSGVALVTVYVLRRRHWSRWMRAQTDDAVVRLEALLREHDDHA